MPTWLAVGALATVVVLQGGALAWRSTQARQASPPPGRASDPSFGWTPEAVDLRLASLERDRPVTLLDRPTREVTIAEAGGISLGAPTGSPAAARRAVSAAMSAIGTPYSWGGVSPATGFDCSGLTRWAWAQAGVSLPHNSGAQYAALPRISTSQLRPGDLVFFYSPISHVGMYVGNGMMIDAQTMNDTVGIRPVWWDSLVGAARPGG